MTPRRTDVGLLLAWAAAAVAVGVLAGVVAVLLWPAPSTATPATAGPADSGLSAADATLLAAAPVRSTPAPGFALTDQHGRPVRLSGFRGRAVVLSFTDDRCTNICTLLAEDIVAADHDLLIRVRDSGPGVPHDMREAIFMDGVTTKSSATGARRGLGLALVRQVVESRNGMISIGHDNGAVFTAVLPKCVGIVQETPHEKAPARP